MDDMFRLDLSTYIYYEARFDDLRAREAPSRMVTQEVHKRGEAS